jgi:hypothetical protein
VIGEKNVLSTIKTGIFKKQKCDKTGVNDVQKIFIFATDCGKVEVSWSVRPLEKFFWPVVKEEWRVHHAALLYLSRHMALLVNIGRSLKVVQHSSLFFRGVAGRAIALHSQTLHSS